MELKNVRFISVLAAFLSLALAGCGGGGGGDDIPVPNYAGGWNTYVSLVDNTCPREIPTEFRSLYLLHNVNQGVSRDSQGNFILDVVLDDGKDTYDGVGEIGTNADGDRFSVTGSPHELPGFLSGYTCIEIINFDYDSISRQPGSVFANYVTRHSSITCTKGTEVKTCDVNYTGNASGTR